MVQRIGPRAIIAAAIAALVIAGPAVTAPAASAADGIHAATAEQAMADQSAAEQPAADEAVNSSGIPKQSDSEAADAAATESDQGVEAANEPVDASDEEAPQTSETEGVEPEATDLAPVPRPTQSADSAVVQAKVTLTASKARVDPRQSVSLTATIDPAEAAGEVTFFDGDEKIGDAVAVVDGVVTLSDVKLLAGKHRMSARFVAADEEAFAGAKSAGVSVQVLAAVNGATLSWGVKESFRSYIVGNIANGEITLLGQARTSKPVDAYVWPNGAGRAAVDGTWADATFGSADGVRFYGHSGALDLTLTHPRIVVNSATAGALYFDVKGKTLQGGTINLSGLKLAELSLPGYETTNDVLLWQNVGTTLTAEGAQAFGGFYEAGAELDPLTFTLPADGDLVTKDATSITVSASKTKAEIGKKLTFSARVAPNVGGTVTFTANGKPIGKPVTVARGAATVSSSKLAIGMHSVRAAFAPKDDDTYGNSLSKAVQVTITAKQKADRPSKTPTGTGARAGALRWGISSAFAAYVTCVNKEAFGFSHCAKGSVDTSGVGAGYLFPQATGTDWNSKTQTGTVRYSGKVSFSGYGMTLFNVSKPSITVTGPNSATLSTGNSSSYGSASYRLDLSSASKSVGADGEVTWSGVPVQGTLSSGGAGGSGNQSIGLDSLTFTVGSASKASFGSSKTGAAKKQQRAAAAAPPSTTGVTVLTPAEQLTAGGRIEIEAGGFEPGEEGVLVVLYSDPVVLDDSARADANGVVHWTGKLPEDLDGTHTITLQGSANAGAVITIAAASADQSAGSGAPRIDTENVATAGPAASGTGGMPLWQWWMMAASLLAIAACTTLLAVRQRRAAG